MSSSAIHLESEVVTPPPPPYQGYPANQGYPPYPSYPLVVPAAQQPARKNNKLGMAFGPGLIGGALGGLLLGEVISDNSFDGNSLTRLP